MRICEKLRVMHVHQARIVNHLCATGCRFTATGCRFIAPRDDDGLPVSRLEQVMQPFSHISFKFALSGTKREVLPYVASVSPRVAPRTQRKQMSLPCAQCWTPAGESTSEAEPMRNWLMIRCPAWAQGSKLTVLIEDRICILGCEIFVRIDFSPCFFH